MGEIKARTGTDAAQLREELKDLLPPEAVTQRNGDVFINVPDNADGAEVEKIRNRHFPRNLMSEVIAGFNSINVAAITDPEMVKLVKACKLLARVVKIEREDG